MPNRMLIVVCCCLMGTAVLAQNGKEFTAAKKASPRKTSVTAPQAALTPQEERGYKMLDLAEAQASAGESDMRAWSLWQIALAYERTDKTKALGLLDKALQAAREIQDDRSAQMGESAITASGTSTSYAVNPRAYLEREILKSIATIAPDRGEKLLDQVDSRSAQSILASLLTQYCKKGQTERALQLVYRIASRGEMPYDEAMRLMAAMKPEQSSDLARLFMESLVSYRNFSPHRNGAKSAEAFSTMVRQYWMRVPPDAARNAVEELLNQARESEDEQRMKVSVVSSGDEPTFSGSQFEYLLWQMLPILKRLDEGAAREYSKKYTRVAGLQPDSTNSNSPDQPSTSAGESKPKPSMSAAMEGRDPQDAIGVVTEMPKVEQALANASSGHASDAITNTASISDQRLRAYCYEMIARMTWKKDAGAARDAMAKLLETAEKLDAEQQLRTYFSASQTYLLMGQEEDAKKAIEKGLADAGKLYKRDSDANDPNRAMKAFWVSTVGYCALLRQAGRISPAWASSIAQNIDDPEVKLAAYIALASQWLNTPFGAPVIVTKKKGRVAVSKLEELSQ
jgi:hypothetical protein